MFLKSWKKGERILEEIIQLRCDIKKIMNKISVLASKTNMDIHDMADLERYAKTLNNLVNALHTLELRESDGNGK